MRKFYQVFLGIGYGFEKKRQHTRDYSHNMTRLEVVHLDGGYRS